MENKNTITVIDEEGKEKVCDILFTFDSEETKKSYVVYTDNSKDENGKVQVFASIYNKDEKRTKLEDIKTDKEWKIIETILSTLQEELTNNSNN